MVYHHLEELLSVKLGTDPPYGTESLYVDLLG